jgi:hypothetical protein
LQGNKKLSASIEIVSPSDGIESAVRRLRTRRTDWQRQAMDRSQKVRNEANEKLKNAKKAGNQENPRSPKRE